MFIDDNPVEIHEVKAAFPEMDCRLFPRNDYPGIWQLLNSLRNAFGKSIVKDEDALRLRSIRSANTQQKVERSGEISEDDYLRKAEAVITFDRDKSADQPRAFELLNKTNQFNLNGQRLTQSEWKVFVSNPETFVLTAFYKDKYGPLGMIAVVMGSRHSSKVTIKHWVMSCRAFSRRIEYQCLKYIFESLGANEITFDYQATARNSPIQNLLTEQLAVPFAPGAILRRDAFFARTPRLFHQIEVKAYV
jgi:FkbH-like protein